MGLHAKGLADDIAHLAFGLTPGSIALAAALAFGLHGRGPAAGAPVYRGCAASCAGAANLFLFIERHFMRFLLFPIAAALLALACGDSGTSDRGSDPARAAGEVGQQLQQGTEATRDAAASAAGSAGTALERGPDVAAPAVQDLAAGVGSADAQTCLALVSEKRYADAVGVCTAALKRDPDSEPLSEALETAREGAAAAMGDAIGAARDGAAGRLDGALGGTLPGTAGQ